MPKFYSIKAKAGAPRAAEVFIYGDIGESWYGESVTAADFVKEFSALDADTVTVRINSYGGSVTDGIAIYNAIKRHKAAVTVEIDGIAASIASLIAMAGDSVRMADNAMVMVHAPWGGIMGNAAEMREYADLLDKYADAMSTSYASKTGQDIETIGALLKDGADHWYNAAEALDFGFVDELTEAMPVAASFDLSRFHSIPAAAAAFSVKEKTMPETLAPTPAAAAPAPVTTNETEIHAAGVKAEAQRRADIDVGFAKFMHRDGVKDLLAACHNDTECTVETANKRLLDHLGKDATPVAGSYVVSVEDESDKLRAAGVQAIMARAAVHGVKSDASNPYRGMTLLDMARESCARAGINTRGLGKMEIVAAAFTQSTSDFPILLEEAMHKTLQAAYMTAPDTWSRFCAVGSVSDFRAHNRYRVGSLGNLDAVNELGEYKTKAIPDGEKASITATTKGNIINISRQMVVNDDLGAFVGLANMQGRAAKRTVEAAVYALLAENSGLGPTMGDSLPLFDAGHSNITTGAAISMAAIDADRVAMASQLDVGGNDFLDLRPAVLLVPIGLGGTARTINNAVYDPDTANKLQKPNTVNGLFRDIVDTPRLSGTRRYIFADPGEAPVIEVAFLDGNQTPYLETQDGFDVDGARLKVRLDFGVAAIDYRGAVTNAGV